MVFGGKRGSWSVHVIKHRCTYSTYSDRQYNCGIKISSGQRGGVRKICLKRLPEEAVMKTKGCKKVKQYLEQDRQRHVSSHYIDSGVPESR